MTDKKIIAEIYNLYKKELFIYIYRYTGSIEISEDILHDTFHNLIKYSQKHTIERTGAKAFLYRTAHNLCINHIKHQSGISFPDIDEIRDLHTKNNIANELESRELEEKIYALLDQADPVTRSIFIMKKELNMNIEDIAEYTGKSTRTIRRKLQKLLSYIHENLKKGGFILFFIILKMSFPCITIVL